MRQLAGKKGTPLLSWMRSIRKSNGVPFYSCILGLVVVFGVFFSFFVRQYQSREKVVQYFSLWDEDLGRSLILEKNADLLLKISHQLQDLDKSVSRSFAKTTAASFGDAASTCFFETNVPISLSSLPVGHVGVCFSPQKLLLEALLSPLFLFILFLGTLFSVLAVQRELKKETALSIAREIAELSRQVAHDIRGPLMALKTLSTHARELPEDKSSLLAGATERIHLIAEDLLKKSHPSSLAPVTTSHSKKIGYCFLQEAAQELLPELQARLKHLKVQLVSYEKDSLMIGLSKTEIQRIISNLSQNSAEATAASENSYVSISIHKKNQFAVLEIMDNGCGIEESLIPEILKGTSYGKENGNGLGLSRAKLSVENAGGLFELKSKVGLGTQITLKIPLVVAEEDASLLYHKT